MAHDEATDRWQRLSSAPTVPGAGAPRSGLTGADLLAPAAPAEVSLDEKLRRAYFWIVNRAVISPYYDVAFDEDAGVRHSVGDAGAEVILPAGPAFSSNVLLPLLSFAVGGRCLLVGGPGRGKTTVAVLMGVLAGESADDVRRHVQQGQPQLSVADLVGSPLPRDLMAAERLSEVRVAWRGWLTRPVKIVDEYNRIPTRTQSALLTMVAEGYVESHDQMVRTAPAEGLESWYFTANDDQGGGTFAVIEALRDRMDVTVQSFAFNSRFLDELVSRVEAGERPEEHVPDEIRFGPQERRAMLTAIRAVPVPAPVRRRLEHFTAHFEFVQHGGRRWEYRTKDVVAGAGGDVAAVIGDNTGADLEVDPGSQTLNGVSVRALQTLILYAKAAAWFRGAAEVGVADVRAMLPFVLRDKLRPNLLHPRFDVGSDRELRTDRASWLVDLFDHSNRQFVADGLDVEDPVGELLAQAAGGLDGLDSVETNRRLTAVEAQIGRIAAVGKVYGRDYDNLLALKYLHQRYTSYLRWLAQANRS